MDVEVYIIDESVNKKAYSTIDLSVPYNAQMGIKHHPFYGIGKRVFDVTASGLALVVLCPILLATAVGIKLEDGGSIFYHQKRVGKDEKVFCMYKFRSMSANADNIHEELKKAQNVDAISFKMKDDPRITRMGKFIRKTSIDELPQLINIIKGEMSVVGPRPLPVYEYIEERRRNHYKNVERYSVQQGLTCFWQVDGRSEIDFEERMKLDIKYVREANVWIDFVLIVKTMVGIFTGRGAY